MAENTVKSTAISKDYAHNRSLDFNQLFKEGISIIQELSGKQWTDYNLHDPGVMLLEYLCFAITDLGYRTDFPIADLLAAPNERIDAARHSFFPAERILTSAPITVSDIQKHVIDAVKEVGNIWLFPILSQYTRHHVQGKYRVQIQLDADYEESILNDPDLRNDVLRRVRNVLNESRNIGEYYEDISIINPQPFRIDAAVQVTDAQNPEEVLARIYYAIEQYFNPTPNFISPQSKAAIETPPEERYQGPRLRNGILRDNELKNRIVKINRSEIAKTIGAVPGVVYIRSLVVYVGDKIVREPLELEPGFYPKLQPDRYQNLRVSSEKTENLAQPETARGRSEIHLFAGNVELQIRPGLFTGTLLRHREKHSRLSDEKKTPETKAPQGLTGRYRNLRHYSSIQRLLPALYQLGQEEPFSGDPPARRAKVRQLKAYLLFFEQIIANFLAQLDNLGNIYSPALDVNSTTYGVQPLYDVPGIRDLLASFDPEKIRWADYVNDEYNVYLKVLRMVAETEEEYQNRKGRILSHLLARFNIAADDFPARRFEQEYSLNQLSSRINEPLKWKSALLRNVQSFTRDRAKMPGNFHPGTIEKGFVAHICLLLHIQIRSSHRKLAHVVKKLFTDNAGGSKNMKMWETSWKSLTIDEDREDPQRYTTIPVEYTDDPDSEKGFQFRNQTQAFFDTGTDIRNYRILPDQEENSTKFLVLFKNPDATSWQLVRRYESRKLAAEGLTKWIEALMQASINSEGFHIVEHSLLAPDLDLKLYGFEFEAEVGFKVQQAYLMTFREREELIMQIVLAANKEDEIEKAKELIQLHCTPLRSEKPGSKLSDMAFTETELGQVLQMLQTIRPIDLLKNPKLDFTLRLWNNQKIAESFLGSKVTILLPNWPKRFQREDFCQFVEQTFSKALPAHISASFRWLNISEMQEFEHLYFHWIDEIRNPKPSSAQENREALISYLQATKSA